MEKNKKEKKQKNRKKTEKIQMSKIENNNFKTIFKPFLYQKIACREYKKFYTVPTTKSLR